MPQEEMHAKPVVRQLRQISKKIATVESNVELFSNMVRQGVPSDDARCFMVQQRNKQRINKQLTLFHAGSDTTNSTRGWAYMSTL